MQTTPGAAEEEPGPTEVELQHLDEKVDLVLSDHAVIVAQLEARARREAERAGFSHPVPPREPPRVRRRTWDPAEVHLDEQVLVDRKSRDRFLRELRPGVVRPAVDPPIVTRAGVFSVPPDFKQVRGLDAAMDADLLRSGIRSANRFLQTSDLEVSRLTGLSLTDVSRAKDDIELTRLARLDNAAADLLRLAGIHSVSALADSTPAVLHATIQRLQVRHRFYKLPPALGSEEGITALVRDAQGQT